MGRRGLAPAAKAGSDSDPYGTTEVVPSHFALPLWPSTLPFHFAVPLAVQLEIVAGVQVSCLGEGFGAAEAVPSQEQVS
jgi:hypothetical protein